MKKIEMVCTEKKVDKVNVVVNGELDCSYTIYFESFEHELSLCLNCDKETNNKYSVGKKYVLDYQLTNQSK